MYVTRGSRAWKTPPSCSLPGCVEFTRLPSQRSEGQGWSSRQTMTDAPYERLRLTGSVETVQLKPASLRTSRELQVARCQTRGFQGK